MREKRGEGNHSNGVSVALLLFFLSLNSSINRIFVYQRWTVKRGLKILNQEGVAHEKAKEKNKFPKRHHKLKKKIRPPYATKERFFLENT